MAIEIRKRRKPRVTLVGKRLDLNTGVYESTPSTTTIGNKDVRVGTMSRVGTNKVIAVRNREPLVYFGDVQVTVAHPDIYLGTSYNTSADRKYMGGLKGIKKIGGNTTAGYYVEVYGTVNGKDPSRTKRHLWSGTTRTIGYNKTGSDNMDLRVRTYYRGESSDVLRIQMRIINRNSSTFKNNNF